MYRVVCGFFSLSRKLICKQCDWLIVLCLLLLFLLYFFFGVLLLLKCMLKLWLCLKPTFVFNFAKHSCAIIDWTDCKLCLYYQSLWLRAHVFVCDFGWGVCFFFKFFYRCYCIIVSFHLAVVVSMVSIECNIIISIFFSLLYFTRAQSILLHFLYCIFIFCFIYFWIISTAIQNALHKHHLDNTTNRVEHHFRIVDTIFIR